MDIQLDAPLAPWTTLNLGGPARRLVTATTREEVVAAVRESDGAGARVVVLGGGSNLVVPDAGVDATVIRIASRGVHAHGGAVSCEAGEPWEEVVSWAVGAGLAGIEALSGIPGSAGATPVQNVGAYGQEVAESITSVQVYDRKVGQVVEMSPAECGFGYRTSLFKRDDRRIVLAVTFSLEPAALSEPVRYAELARALGIELGQRAPLADLRRAVLALRRGKGMVLDPDDADTRSVGSFFTNPILTPSAFDQLCERLGPGVSPPAYDGGKGAVKTSAAWLIERAGFGKGYGTGPVRTSTKHSLALTNRGGGTTADLLALAREIRDGVQGAFGVRLEHEPVLLDTIL